MPANARPNVAIDVTPLIGLRTGIGSAVAEILSALQALEAAPAIIPYTLSVRARQHRPDVPSDTRFVPLPARILLQAWGRIDGPRIDRWLRPADVVHATNYLTPPSRLPTMVSVYDCSFVRYPELCTPEVRAFVPIVRRAVARGATVHTTSKFVAGEIEEIFGPGLERDGRLVVIPLGVPAIGTDAEMPPEVEPRLDGAPFVLAIGTHRTAQEPRAPRRRVRVGRARAARSPSRDRGPGRPGAWQRRCGDRATRAARSRTRVVLPGPVSDAGRRALLDRAAVLAYPSIYEGFGFPVLEAMTAGVPVVAARAGSIPEVAGDAALLVDATDVQQLADAVTRVITDDTTRHELVARGRDRVRQFSWADTARALASCYRRLVGTRTDS